MNSCPWLAEPIDVVQKSRQQKGCINTNRLALLANKINAVAADGLDSANAINAYHHLTQNSPNSVSFPHVTKPRVSIILPFTFCDNKSANGRMNDSDNVTADLSKLLASLCLSMPNDDYEVVGLSHVLNNNGINNHANNIVNVGYCCASKLGRNNDGTIKPS
ncbi:hypothetical protein PEC18_30725 [Paucibacter sp. O1-1]|nr:hypothetical protein [Paucibacter sp. O1-1]MDA3830083.1 hypothetical protein [Paucibacter sp. O1-1]